MKARIKKTGEIVDVTRNKYGLYVDETYVGYHLSELDFGNEEDEHWQDVRERAAIAALNGLLSNPDDQGRIITFAKEAVEYADALVKQLKGK